MLEGQAEFPVLDAGEMGMNRQLLNQRLNAIPGYVQEFQQVYGRRPNDTDFCRALASFERTLVSKDEPFGRYLSGDLDAFYDAGPDQDHYDDKMRDEAAARYESIALRGALLFIGLIGQQKQDQVMAYGDEYTHKFIKHYFDLGRSGCASCHNGPDYRDGSFHRTGVAFQRTDDGLQVISNNNRDLKKFKTPTLLNVAETAPYFHDGSRASLEQVVRFYNQGGVNDPLRDTRIRPLGMTVDEEQMLVYFLRKGMQGVYPKVEQPVLP